MFARVVTSLSLGLIAVSSVKAQNSLTIDTPTNVVQCQPTFFVWHDSTASDSWTFTLASLVTHSTLQLVGTKQPSYLWSTDIDPTLGPFLGIVQNEASLGSGLIAQTQPFNVTSAPDNCKPAGTSTSSSSSSSSSSTPTTTNIPGVTSTGRQDTGLIVGASVGGVALLAVLAAGLWFFCIRNTDGFFSSSRSPRGSDAEAKAASFEANSEMATRLRNSYLIAPTIPHPYPQDIAPRQSQSLTREAKNRRVAAWAASASATPLAETSNANQQVRESSSRTTDQPQGQIVQQQGAESAVSEPEPEPIIEQDSGLRFTPAVINDSATLPPSYATPAPSVVPPPVPPALVAPAGRRTKGAR